MKLLGTYHRNTFLTVANEKKWISLKYICIERLHLPVAMPIFVLCVNNCILAMFKKKGHLLAFKLSFYIHIVPREKMFDFL